MPDTHVASAAEIRELVPAKIAANAAGLAELGFEDEGGAL